MCVRTGTGTKRERKREEGERGGGGGYALTSRNCRTSLTRSSIGAGGRDGAMNALTKLEKIANKIQLGKLSNSKK